MPAYKTHMINSEILYKSSIKDKKIFKINIPKDKLKIFSLGHDLSFLTSIGFDYISHNKNITLYFINLITYIKENKLYNDKNIMAYLYGHINHYYLDTLMHPYVYSIESSIPSLSLIDNHKLYEHYIDEYFNYIYPTLTMFDIEFNKGLINTINTTYKKTFNKSNVYNSYKLSIKFLKLLENNKDLLKMFKIDYDNFLSLFSTNELTNQNNDIWYNPFTKEKHNESINDLFNKSIYLSKEVIEVINKIIYGNMSIDKVNRVIKNISYDTGSYLPYKKLKYVKNK